MQNRRRLLKRRSGPSPRGRFLTYLHRGQLVTAIWPRARGRPTHPNIIRQNQRLAQAVRLAKIQPPEIINGLLQSKWLKGFFLYDWLVKAACGNAWAIDTPGNRTFWPMSLVDDVSANLDVLFPTPGGVLFRGPIRWGGLPVGPPGSALAVNAAGTAPEWVPGQSAALIAEAVAASNVLDIQGLDFSPFRAVTAHFESVSVSVDGAACNLQFYIAGTLITAAYKWAASEGSSSGSGGFGGSGSAASIPLFSNIGNAAGKVGSAFLAFTSPASAAFKNFSGTSTAPFSTTNIAVRHIAGQLANTSPLTGLRLTPSTGNITGARLRLFGSPFPAA